MIKSIRKWVVEGNFLHLIKNICNKLTANIILNVEKLGRWLSFVKSGKSLEYPFSPLWCNTVLEFNGKKTIFPITELKNKCKQQTLNLFRIKQTIRTHVENNSLSKILKAKFSPFTISKVKFQVTDLTGLQHSNQRLSIHLFSSKFPRLDFLVTLAVWSILHAMPKLLEPSAEPVSLKSACSLVDDQTVCSNLQKITFLRIVRCIPVEYHIFP